MKEETEDGEEAEETEESLAAGRFVEMFLRHLLRGIDAKEKFVRLRVCQLIALAMNSLGEIEYSPRMALLILVTICSMTCGTGWERGREIGNRLFGYKL